MMVSGSEFHKVGPETARFFVCISLFWNEVLQGLHVLQIGQTPSSRPTFKGHLREFVSGHKIGTKKTYLINKKLSYHRDSLHIHTPSLFHVELEKDSWEKVDMLRCTVPRALDSPTVNLNPR